MMLKFLKSIWEALFPKEVTIDSTPTAYDPTIYLDDACNLLEVDPPNFKIVATIFESMGQVMAVDEEGMKDIPPDAHNFVGGFIPDDSDTVFLSAKYPNWDLFNNNSFLDFIDLRPYELAFPMLHETRHVWQKTYHKKMYEKNAVSFESIKDRAEIDADAFAIAYLFSDKTNFTINDFPTQSIEIALQATLDGGKRWERAVEIQKEYGFGGKEKLEEAKEKCKEICEENKKLYLSAKPFVYSKRRA